MPVMKRSNKLAQKIAYKILGIPANMQNRNTKNALYLRKKLQYQGTSWVKQMKDVTDRLDKIKKDIGILAETQLEIREILLDIQDLLECIEVVEM